MPVHRSAGAALIALALLTGCTSSGGNADGRRSAAPSGPAGADGGPSTYLALGDSVAAGIGAPSPTGGGYVPLLTGLLSARLGCAERTAPGCPLELRNLAVSGATTTTLLRDQLPRALQLLDSGADVRLVTLTIGGNDVFLPVARACASAPQAASCRTAVVEALAGVDRGVDEALSALRAAAGPGAPVAVMAYYDPLPACRLAPLSGLAQQVLEGSGEQPGLNDVLRARAAAHDARVVETGPRLSAPRDFVGGDDCLHPSGSGHARIAQTFDDAVGAQVAAGGRRGQR